MEVKSTGLDSGIVVIYLHISQLCAGSINLKIKHFMRIPTHKKCLKPKLFITCLRESSPNNMRCVTRKQTLKSLLLSYRGRAHPSFGMTPTFKKFDFAGIIDYILKTLVSCQKMDGSGHATKTLRFVFS